MIKEARLFAGLLVLQAYQPLKPNNSINSHNTLLPIEKKFEPPHTYSPNIVSDSTNIFLNIAYCKIICQIL